MSDPMSADRKCERCAGEGKLHRQDCGAHGLTVPCAACVGTGTIPATSCERCDTPVNHRHGNLCAACIADDMDYDDNGCANCGGEGFTYGCSWDWQCDTYDDGEGTCLCTRPCDWCSPPKPTPETDALRKLLGDMLRGATP